MPPFETERYYRDCRVGIANMDTVCVLCRDKISAGEALLANVSEVDRYVAHVHCGFHGWQNLVDAANAVKLDALPEAFMPFKHAATIADEHMLTHLVGSAIYAAAEVLLSDCENVTPEIVQVGLVQAATGFSVAMVALDLCSTTDAVQRTRQGHLCNYDVKAEALEYLGARYGKPPSESSEASGSAVANVSTVEVYSDTSVREKLNASLRDAFGMPGPEEC